MLAPVLLFRGLGTLSVRRAALLTLVAGLGYALLAYSGFAFAPAAHAAVLLPGALPFSTAILAVIVLGERITPARFVSLGLILAGIVLISWNGFRVGEPGTWRGDLLFLAASSTWALYTVLARRWKVSALDATTVIAVLSMVVYLPVYAIALPSRLEVAEWGEIVFQGLYQGLFAVVIAGIAYTRAVTALGPATITTITALVPGTAALAAVPALGEPLHALTVAGLGAVTLGMLAGVRTMRGR